MADPDREELESAADRPDYTQRLTFTYMIGVYLAVNAVRDLYLLVEGPDCTYMKTQFVQGNHDWLSTLTSVSGFHRIANTALHPSQMTASREAAVHDALMKIATNSEVPAVALTSMPMAFITGADYERLTREVSTQTGKPALAIPGKSLSGDWLDGYAQALQAFASQLDLSGGHPERDQVAVIGNLFDRNEGDQEANVVEIRRILEALGLHLTTVWLSGESFANLGEARHAGTIISLPYGRRAARTVARRTGADLLELPLPFGLDATESFVRTLGAHFGCEQQADAFVNEELARIVPRLEWVVPFLFQNRRVGFVGEPHVLPGLADIVNMLGAELRFGVLTNRSTHDPTLSERLGGLEVLWDPRTATMRRFLMEWSVKQEIHLLISHNLALLDTQGAALEFGFPSMFRHALYQRPYLGFDGTLSFVDSMANALRMHELELAKRKYASHYVSARTAQH